MKEGITFEKLSDAFSIFNTMLENLLCSALTIFILIDEMEILDLGNICYLRKIICEFNKIKDSRRIYNNTFEGISLSGIISG